MLEFVAKYWPLLLFVGGAIATSAVAIYQVRQHETKVNKHDQKIDDIETSVAKLSEASTIFEYHLKDRRKNPVRTIDGCLGERDACPIKAELEKDREIKTIENNAVTSSLMRMEILNKERHREILDEFNLHRQTHIDMDRRYNDLSEKVAVLYEKVTADRKHNERKGDRREG